MKVKHPFVLALALGLLPLSGRAQAQQTKPNIVFILAGNLGYGEWGVHGGGILTADLRTFPQEHTALPSPAPRLDFPSTMPHTPSTQAPNTLRWSDHGLEDTAGLHHRIG